VPKRGLKLPASLKRCPDTNRILNHCTAATVISPPKTKPAPHIEVPAIDNTEHYIYGR
jgi:hypothetical protein